MRLTDFSRGAYFLVHPVRQTRLVGLLGCSRKYLRILKHLTVYWWYILGVMRMIANLYYTSVKIYGLRITLATEITDFCTFNSLFVHIECTSNMAVSCPVQWRNCISCISTRVHENRPHPNVFMHGAGPQYHAVCNHWSTVVNRNAKRNKGTIAQRICSFNCAF